MVDRWHQHLARKTSGQVSVWEMWAWGKCSRIAEWVRSWCVRCHLVRQETEVTRRIFIISRAFWWNQPFPLPGLHSLSHLADHLELSLWTIRNDLRNSIQTAPQPAVYRYHPARYVSLLQTARDRRGKQVWSLNWDSGLWHSVLSS